MQRATAYAALAAELENWRSLPLTELLAAVGLPATPRLVHAEREELVLEVKASWLSKKRRAIKVSGIAYGPSHLRMERLDESFVVTLPP